MPELRITFYEGVGWDGVDVLFCGDGGAGWHVGLDDGEALHGRKAFLRIKGVDVPLEIYTFTKEINGRTSVDFERVSIPGNAGMAVIANDDFVNDDERFVCAEKVVPQLVDNPRGRFVQPRRVSASPRRRHSGDGPDRCSLRARE